MTVGTEGSNKFQDMVATYKQLKENEAAGAGPEEPAPARWSSGPSTGPCLDPSMQCGGETVASENGMHLNNPSAGYTDVLCCYLSNPLRGGQFAGRTWNPGKSRSGRQHLAG